MAKLYPPQINGTIPAFYSDINSGTTKIVVPFSMNRAVSVNEIGAMQLKIKSLNGTKIGVVNSNLFDTTTKMTATFDLTPFRKDLHVGNYYKIQLAYIDGTYNEVGYFSTVGVTKYSVLPKVEIAGLNFRRINTHRYSYVGIYSQANGDSTEKLYSSRFIIYDGNDIFCDSGEILHNNTNDEYRDQAQEEYKLPKELVVDRSYTIVYQATTTNGLQVNSQRYRIVMRRSIDPNIHAELVATLDYNNGYVALTLNDDIDPIVSGQFVISRASNVNNWQWDKIKEFNLQSTPPKKFIFKDCTVEQGLIYRYSLQQYNDKGIYSSRILSNDIEVDFEDAFLFDGERQLRIRFNPKVSSFKTDLQEQKTDTIGHQYPFITRNSHVYYKEFPISGLISYLVDENELFLTKNEIGIELITYSSLKEDVKGDDNNYYNRNRKETRYNTTTNLTAKNIAAERIFKMEVLKWLNNGKPKSFRSPGEGNYLVRLMNVSLSPNDATGRMLHTFSCTAYEIADYNLTNLATYEIYDPIKSVAQQRRWVTVDIAKFIEEKMYEAYGKNPNYTKDQQWFEALNKTYQEKMQDLMNWNATQPNNQNKAILNIISGRGLPEISVQDLLPGSEIFIDQESIIIGATGAYKVINDLNPFSEISINLNSVTSGLITYAFDAKASDTFSTIEEIIVQDVPCRQIIGNSYYKTEPIINKRGEITGFKTINNVLDYLQNCKTTILRINLLKVTKRPIIDAFLVTEESITSIRNQFRNYTITHNPTPALRNLKFTCAELEGEQDIRFDKSVQDMPQYELPLYQLRMPRTDYRPSQSDYSVLNFEGDETEYHYIYKDNEMGMKSYTFEQYYIDKNMDRFCPYTGYFYDPHQNIIIAADNDLFHFYVDGEDFDVSEIETWKVRDLKTNTESIIFNNGVIGELSYSKQDTVFQFDSLNASENERSAKAYNLRQDYENLLAQYLLTKDGRKSSSYTNSILDYIESYIPIAWDRIRRNKAVYDGKIYQLEDINDSVPQNWGDDHILGLNSGDDGVLTDAIQLTYQEELLPIKDELDRTYEDYIAALDEAIQQYREENGIE